MLQAHARTVAWAKEFVPSFRLPDADAFTLPPEARIGFMKRFADAIEPQIEGDIGPVVFCLMTAFGSATGHGPHVTVGAGQHHANTNACTVAPSGVGKSEPWDTTTLLMEQADPQWRENCVCFGLGSGEGLIERLRDGWTEAKRDKQGQMQFVQHPGAAHKNLLVVEAEFGRVINLGRRDGATLGQILCFGWDGKTMEVANRGQNKLKASGHHLSIWANITLAEIRRKIRNSLEEENGFVNRFLWPWQSQRRSLAFGGDMACLDALAPALAQAIARAKCIAQVRWAACGAALWEKAYPKLKAVQTHMEALGRARSQALRLALLYALLDGSNEIREAHVTAGLAAWAYAEASARLIFGDEPAADAGSATAPPMATAVLKAITKSPGVSRKGLYDALGHGMKAEALSDALLWLESQGHAYRQTVKTGTGRPAECWWPAQGREPEEEPQQHPPDQGPASAGAESLGLQAGSPRPGQSSHPAGPDADAQQVRKEGTISEAAANAHAHELRKEGIISPPVQKPHDDAGDSSFLPTPPAAALDGGGVGCVVQPEAQAVPDEIWFGVSEPLPEGWLDAVADADLIERIWPVPKGWHRSSHGMKLLGGRDEGGFSGHSVFNPKWPVRAIAPTDLDDDGESLERVFSGDPSMTMIVMPQSV